MKPNVKIEHLRAGLLLITMLSIAVENDSPPPGAAHESNSEKQATSESSSEASSDSEGPERNSERQGTSESSSDSERPPFEDSASDVEAGYLPLGKSCYELNI